MRRAEDGFSLIELLVVMVLVGVIGTFVTSSIITSMNVSRQTSQRATALHDIERALQVVARELRVADPIYLTDDGDYANVIGAEVVRDRTVQVHTFVIDTEDQDGIKYLFQDITEYDLDEVGPDGDPLTATPVALPRRRLITDIDNAGIDAVFTYHDPFGDEISCEGLTATACETDIADAAQIGIRLVRNLVGQEPIRAETRVTVRNTRYGRALS